MFSDFAFELGNSILISPDRDSLPFKAKSCDKMFPVAECKVLRGFGKGACPLPLNPGPAVYETAALPAELSGL